MRVFNVVTGLVGSVGLLLATSGTVLAAPQGPLAGDRVQAQRVVMECGTDAATRRAFTREHGQRPVFVTAREVQSARASSEAWSAPRCMTARERSRLIDAATDYARSR